MKYIKLFLLLAVAAVGFSACSDDDDTYNTASNVTVGFESDTLTTKENAGYVNIPIAIEGYRNGDVQLTLETSETGTNPAKEGVNYLITDKSLQLLAQNDTTSSAVLNVQLKTLDDDEINENRTFTLSITSCNGGTVARKDIVVVLRDNDAAFYEKFFGKWTLTGTVEGSSGVSDFTKTITISGPTDESDADYDNLLTVSAPSFVDVGINLDFTWHFGYSFDITGKTGSLSLILGEVNATYGTRYQWTLYTDDGQSLVDDPIVTPWQLGDEDAFPTTITFDETKSIYMYQPGAGTWRIFTFKSMTKQ